MTPILLVQPGQVTSALDTLQCAHCGTPVRRDASTWYNEQPYCCHGCEGVARLVHENGWDRFYEKRDGWSPSPDADADTRAFNDEGWQQTAVRRSEDGKLEVDLQVDGIRCAACTFLVERAVGSLEGVEACQVSYGNGVARIAWDPEKLKLGDIARRMTDVGYRPLLSKRAPTANRELLARFGVAAFCAGNVMTLSVASYAGWFDGMAEHFAALFRWASLAVTTPAVFYSSVPFFERAWAGIREKVPGMDVPIALAIVLLYAHGLVMTFVGHEGYLDSLTMLIALLLAGRFVEDAGRSRAEDAAASVVSQAPSVVRRRTADGVEEVAVHRIQRGDRILVGNGMVLPLDGLIVDGEARLDLSLLTGESVPVAVQEGQTISAGALVVDGSLEVVVERVGEETTLSRIARRVADARMSRPKVMRWADRIAPVFTVATLVVASLTFAVWAFLGGVSAALPPTVAVLVTACPCALALATPTALAVAMGAAARRGAWVRDADAVLALGGIDQVMVDKTGTVTEGKPQVIEASDNALQLAAAVERGSSHPVARAILEEARLRGLALLPAREIHEVAGVGISGIVDGRAIEVGRGLTGVAVRSNGELLGEILLKDRLRADTLAVMRTISQPISLLTGDTERAANEFQRQVEAAGLRVSVAAGMTPESKSHAIEAARANGSHVLYVGDGLNDAERRRGNCARSGHRCAATVAATGARRDSCRCTDPTGASSQRRHQYRVQRLGRYGGRFWLCRPAGGRHPDARFEPHGSDRCAVD
jgi:P-type Cu2+ transporter